MKLVQPDAMTDRDTRLLALEDRISKLENVLASSAARIEPDTLYTVAKASLFLACSGRNVYELMVSGELARTRVGAGSHGFRIRGSDIVAFMDSRREGGPQPRGAFNFLKNRPA
jgi:hypothetical protein